MLPRKSTEEYYADLGLRLGASRADIRRAYIKLVKQWHPDRFTHDPRSQPIAEEKLKQVNEAYFAVTSSRATQPHSYSSYQYRPPQTAQQRATGSYNTANSSATGQRPNSAGQGFRPRPNGANHSSPYTYTEAPSRETPRWVMWLIWITIMAGTNIFRSGGNSVTQNRYAPPAPTPPVITFPSVQDSQVQMQKEIEQAMKAMQADKSRQPLNLKPRPGLDERMASMLAQNARTQQQTRQTPAFEPETKSGRRNYPVPHSDWPGFKLADTAPAKASKPVQSSLTGQN
jgi:curved DNA-binding protein CbpA